MDLPIRLNTNYRIIEVQNQADLTAFCQKYTEDPAVEALAIDGTIRGYNVEDFTVLQGLRHLKKLQFKYTLSQVQFDQICQLRLLRSLCILDCRKITDIDNLAKLQSLEALVFSVPLAVSTHHHVTDLNPLATVSNLRQLELGGIIIDTDGIEPLRGLTQLAEIQVMKRYQAAAAELLAAQA